MGGISKMALDEGCSKISKSEVAIAAMRCLKFLVKHQFLHRELSNSWILLKIER